MPISRRGEVLAVRRELTDSQRTQGERVHELLEGGIDGCRSSLL
jgi:hypothetical protein